jgi:hypothetical protein
MKEIPWCLGELGKNMDDSHDCEIHCEHYGLCLRMELEDIDGVIVISEEQEDEPETQKVTNVNVKET